MHGDWASEAYFQKRSWYAAMRRCIIFLFSCSTLPFPLFKFRRSLSAFLLPLAITAASFQKILCRDIKNLSLDKTYLASSWHSSFQITVVMCSSLQVVCR